MTDTDLARLFVVLAGYWPGSAPTADDPVAVAAHRDLLGDLDPDVVLGAVRVLAYEGREFCPPPGVIAAHTRPARVGPERDAYELTEAPADVLPPEEQARRLAALRDLLAKNGRRLEDW